MAKASEKDNSAINILDSSTVIRGDIESTGRLRIDGKIIGTLRSQEKVILGQSGFVEGEVHCKSAEISGKLKGKVVIEELLSLTASAQLEGEVVTKKLAIEPGAVFNASCKMTDNPSNTGPKPNIVNDKKEKEKQAQHQPA
ncbi:MAG: polymer-forming cytoskeletal protein [Bacteroidales bacterium]